MNLANLLATLQANVDQTDITLYPPASLEDISHFERRMKLTLPADFKTFYSFCNGFESAEDWFRMVPLEEVLERASSHLRPNTYSMAEYLIYCDMWEVEFGSFDPQGYRIMNDHRGRGINVVLTHSLAVFLQRFLSGGVFGTEGLYDWAEELSQGKLGDLKEGSTPS